jgi:hypothetical protein
MISLRLRVGRDEDLEAAFESLPAYIDRSDVIREALRQYFFESGTPIRNSLGNLDLTLSQVETPLKLQATTQQKEVQPKSTPKLIMDFNSVPVVRKENDVNDKLNKSLGF